MRPQSETRIALSAALIDGPGTSKQLATRVGVSHAEAMRTLDNMTTAGDVRKTMQRVPGVCRPVPVYHRAARPADTPAANDDGYCTLVAAWMGLGGVA